MMIERLVPEIIKVVGSVFEDRYQRALTEMRRLFGRKDQLLSMWFINQITHVTRMP